MKCLSRLSVCVCLYVSALCYVVFVCMCFVCVRMCVIVIVGFIVVDLVL